MNSPEPVLGMRSNNPWNLQQEHIDWAGLTANQAPSGELVFDDLIDGIRAGVLVCYAYQRRGLNTIGTFLPKFSPAAANNPTAQYETDVCTWTGWDRNRPIDFHSAVDMLPFARAIFRQEDGAAAEASITDAQIQAGIELAQGD